MRRSGRVALGLATIVGLLSAALAFPVGASAGRTAPAGCSWPLTLRNINFAYPDTSADYWMTHFGALPGSRLVIRGRFPDARYFSFHAYDEAQRPVASIADHEIIPDRGMNPFASSTGRGRESGTYTVSVVFEPKPDDPEPNTVYAGEMDNGARNPGGFVIYRIYIPDDPKGSTGGVPLPTVTMETAGGAVEQELGHCEPLPPPTGSTLDDEARQRNYQYVGSGRTHVPGTDPVPVWKRFYGTDREFRDWCPDPRCQDTGPKMKSGFLANEQIAYLYARISREYGDVIVLRMRVPTFPDTRSGAEPTDRRQVRYWSICQNNDASQRVVSCSPDYDTVVRRHPDLGGRAYATFVISDPEDRPDNATRAEGINYLEWGGFYYSGIVIYRQMLPAGAFDEAIRNIQEGTPPAKIMKTYHPLMSYCTKETFERHGADACLGPATH